MKPEDVLKPLGWLAGTWKSITATVTYPTMKNPVNYCELLSFSDFGQPLLGYSSLTWNPKTKAYMHVEGGHLRIAEDGCTICLLTAQNFGICTVEDGTVKNCFNVGNIQGAAPKTKQIEYLQDICVNPKKRNNSMEVVASFISHSIFAKKKVCAISRCYSLNEKGQLEYKMMLQTEAVPLTDHLKVLYEKDRT